MSETQQLSVAEAPSGMAQLTTPSRRGHRHKRSFAISGDFEFLKQPPASVPPIPTFVSPVKPRNRADGSVMGTDDDEVSGDARQPRVLLTEPKLSTTTYLLKTPRKLAEPINSPSPRFFISEEPRFSSPVKGVPDAIINLDDVLKTKPRSFKTHRRTESAPADLEIVFNAKGNLPNDQRIDEEDDDSDSVNSKKQIVPGLMSPLRPSSPTFQRSLSPVKTPSMVSSEMGSNDAGSNSSNAANANDKYNSLKIKRQKQRYYYYTKQLPMTTRAVPPQSLREQTSASSLASNVSRTPMSQPYTPCKQELTTPATPLYLQDQVTIHIPTVNNGGSNLNVGSHGTSLNFLGENTRRPLSPDFQARQNKSQLQPPSLRFNSAGPSNPTIRRNSANATTSFNFESKVYDIRYDEDGVKPKRDEMYDTTNYSSKTTLISEFQQDKGSAVLSDEILLGEPGDEVDLASLNSTQDIVDGMKQVYISKGPSTHSLQASVTPESSSMKEVSKKLDRKTELKGEIRSSSDSALPQGQSTAKVDTGARKKKRSRFSSFLTNILK